MKRNLPAGERYGLFSRFDRNSNYKTIITFVLMAMNCFVSNTVSAQKIQKKLTHFQIGDKISKNFVLGTSLEDSTKVITMKDYRGKAVILDFWATYCGTCIANFPLVDSLNKVFDKNLEVVLLHHPSSNRENRHKVKNFMASYQELHPLFDLPVVMIDYEAKKRFYVPSIPHYIWLDANGRIKAITFSNELTNSNIQELVSGRTLKLKQKTHR